MDATPGSAPCLAASPLPAPALSQPSAPRDPVVGSWLRAALVSLVFVCGLLQGSRAALGRMPLAGGGATSKPAAGAHYETDALRGHFYRPEGSDAVRPTLRLRPSAWRPPLAEPSLRACAAAGC